MGKNILRCKIGKTIFKNPVIAASGTFGYGDELGSFLDINKLGGFVTKTITLKPKEGNAPPRIYDLGFGVVNSIGLENPGLDGFKKKYSGFLSSVKTNVFISIHGKKLSDWSELIVELDKEKIAGFELNLSCPNIKGEIISGDKKASYKLVSRLRKFTKKTMIAKLSYSPQIKEVAAGLKAAGVDALTAINTLPALVLDKDSLAPVLGAVSGGLSGACIKPVALKCVYELARAGSVPIIGCGGINNYKDVLEFLSLGAKAIQVGTANLVNPGICARIIKDLSRRL